MRALLAALCWTDRKARGLAIRLNGGIHPKHNVQDDRHRWWARHAAGKRVLDLGCGTGAHAAEAIRSGADGVMGLDRNKAVIDVARTRSLRATAFLVGDVMTSWRKPVADLVLCFDVLEHVEDRPLLLAAVKSALLPGGLLALTAPNRETTWRRRLRAAGLDARYDFDHKVEYLWPELEAELKEAGFRVIECFPIVYDDGPLTGLKDLLGAVWPAWFRVEMRRRVQRAARCPGETKGWAIIAEQI